MSGEDEVENERRKRKRKNGVPGMGGVEQVVREMCSFLL